MEVFGKPNVTYDCGSSIYETDLRGIVDVDERDAPAMLKMGCIPLLPVGWVDPRVVHIPEPTHEET